MLQRAAHNRGHVAERFGEAAALLFALQRGFHVLLRLAQQGFGLRPVSHVVFERDDVDDLRERENRQRHAHHQGNQQVGFLIEMRDGDGREQPNDEQRRQNAVIHETKAPILHNPPVFAEFRETRSQSPALFLEPNSLFDQKRFGRES